MSATKAYWKFLTFTLAAISLFVVYICLQSLILADRIMGFQHQMVRYQNELIRGDYTHLEDLDLLVIGDSTAAQNVLPPNLVNLNAASLAISGGSSIESYYILKRYLDTKVPHNRLAPRCVLLMTSYGAHRYHIKNFFWPLTVGHGSISADEALDLFQESSKVEAWPSTEFHIGTFLTKALQEKLKYHLQFGILNQMLFRPGMTFQHSQRSYRTFRRMNGAGPMVRQPIWLEQPFNGPNQDFLNEPFVSDPTIDLYLRKIVELTKHRNIRLVVAYGPLAKSIQNPTSEAWLKAAISHISQLLESESHVLNLLKVRWLMDSNFIDASHLNWAKAIEFTTELSNDLQFCRQL